MKTRVQFFLIGSCVAILLALGAGCVRPGTDGVPTNAVPSAVPSASPDTTADPSPGATGHPVLPTLPIRTPQAGTPNPTIEIPPPIY